MTDADPGAGQPYVAVAAAVTARPLRELLAGLEEEGVPARLVEPTRPVLGADLVALARSAARSSPVGVGVSLDGSGGCVVLAAAPDRAYLREPDPRRLGRAAGRVAARRPLDEGSPG